MKKAYYKEPLVVEIQLQDCTGTDIGIPGCRWTGRIYTPESTRFVEIGQSEDGGRRGWRPSADGQKICVRRNDHGLHPGPLLAEFEFEPADADMDEGCRRIRRRYDLGLYLSSDPCCCIPSAAEAKLILPVIKGEPGPQGEPGEPGPPMSWSDMTEADRRELAADVAAAIGPATGETLTDDEARGLVDDVFGDTPQEPGTEGLLTDDEALRMVEDIFS